MDNQLYQERLVRILQNAYSGELAAGYAYRGHWKSLARQDEIESVRQIEAEEWIHRERVGEMLGRLDSRPLRSREIRMAITGRAIGLACHLLGWFLPMYFAGRLETMNVEEYETAANFARQLGLALEEGELRVMAAVEKEHERFFRKMVANHPWLPLMRVIFKWEPADEASG